MKYGAHPITGEQKEFGWINFKFPACKNCNNKGSILESKVLVIVNRLLNKQDITNVEANMLLDWLDKVRIGMWLAYHYHHKNLLQIKPRFYIENRVDVKDRMLAIYFLDQQSKGLNVWGAETQLFQLKPSCFSMRINKLYILNMSWDFMCSKRCGFPYPKYIKNKDGIFLIEKFIKEPTLKSPICQLGVKIYPPALQLYQPQYEDKYKAMINDINGEQKATFLQQEKIVRKLYDEDKIPFNKLRIIQTTPLHHLIAQMYDFQLKSFLLDKDIFLPDLSPVLFNIIQLENHKCVLAWKYLSEEEHKAIWGK